jgi:ketosteroid isomerase-like protein
MPHDEQQIRALLNEWAKATREARLDDVLKDHSENLVIFDVLPPLKYTSAAAYRKSWGDWQPKTQGDARFELENLSVTAGDQVAFAYGFIQCGGTLPDGQVFSDTVRATFCLQKVSGTWKVVHQHVSKPFSRT